MVIRPQLINLFKRSILIPTSKEKIYHNGDNNLYPNEVERVINNSPTATRSAVMMAKYVAGSVNADYLINEQKNIFISDIISNMSRSITYYNGVFLHVSYGFDKETAKIKPVGLEVLDFTKCRVAKDDDLENKGKVYYHDFEVSGLQAKDMMWYYPFNKNETVIRQQIKADSNGNDNIIEAIRAYRGQVFYLNLMPEYVYPLSPIDSVFNDADSEYRFSIYTNSQMRRGFLGKTTVITQGLDGERNEQIREDIAEFLGAENASNIYHIEVENVENLDNIIKFVQLQPQFDDKLFEQTSRRITRNILGAFNNIPEPLVFSGSGALFGTNAETYKEMKLFYNEQTERERSSIEKTLNYIGFQVKINSIL